MTNPNMPESVANQFEVLQREVAWLHARWIMFRQLFVSPKSDLSILNWASPTFFSSLRRVMFAEIELTLGKLSDPALSSRDANLSVLGLLEGLRSASETTAAGFLEPLAIAFADRCSDLRKRRNKKIAHFDLNTMLSGKASALPKPSAERVESALEALREAMNSVQKYYFGSTMAYSSFVMRGDGRLLLKRLRASKRYEELVRAGRIPRDDIRTQA